MKGGIHFREDDLLELYAERAGKPDAPPVPHFERCPSCAARFAALVRTLDDHADDVRAEADAFFTSDRLSRQCERILHRLQHVTQFARVLSFPDRRAAEGLTMLRRGSMAGLVSRRWVAAAAAAGLMLGFFAERAFHDPRSGSSSQRLARQVGTDGVSSGDRVLPHLVSYEDSILDEIDSVIDRSAIPGLVALDDLTPRASTLPPGLQQ